MQKNISTKPPPNEYGHWRSQLSQPTLVNAVRVTICWTNTEAVTVLGAPHTHSTNEASLFPPGEEAEMRVMSVVQATVMSGKTRNQNSPRLQGKDQQSQQNLLLRNM